MDFQQITTELDDRVLTITLNRPDRLNAWTATMGRELIDAFDRADQDDEVRAVIVTGAGRGFCAGADLAAGGETFNAEAREAAGGTLNPGQPQTPGAVPRDGGGQFTLRVFECTKPVIAAINGPAVGVGATMTLPMDIRLAAEDARIGFVFVRRGIVPEACSSWFLPRIVGISQAMEWVSTGRVFDAQEALAGGLVSKRASEGRTAGRCPRDRHGDRGERRPGLRSARATAAVDDARRRAPDARPSRRLAGNVLSRSVRRRRRRRHLVPGEAAPTVRRPGQ